MASNKLKVGDKVKYVSGRHGWCVINPRDEIGVITQTLESHPKERSHTFPYEVKWEAGTNSYHEGDLELISSPQYTPITPKVGEKYRVLKSFEQSNEQYSIGDVLVYVGEFGPPHARYSLFEDTKPINQSIIQKSMSFIKRLTQSSDDKALLKARFTDDCGNLTSRGQEALISLVFAEKKAELVKLAEEVIAESKE